MLQHRSLAMAGLLLLALLAGCVGGQDPADTTKTEAPGTSGTTDTVTGAADDATGQLATEIGPDSVIEGPSWEVGQWFGYHVFFGVNDTEGVHYDSVVIDDSGDSWTLAPADAYVSKLEAVWDIQVLGEFSKQDLSTTFGGEDWTWYEFPIEEGSTWTSTFSFDAFGQGSAGPYEVTFNATYNPSISIGGGETAPGFDIVGVTSDGAKFMEYDYVPEIGWFAHLFFYDPASEDDEWILHLMAMGHGDAFTGTAYTDEATQVLDLFGGMAPAGAWVEPDPYGSFTMSEEATHLYGFAFAGTWSGIQRVDIIDPNQEQRSFQAAATPMGFSVLGAELYEEAIPGQWHVTNVGAGGAAFGGVLAWETVQTAHEVVDGELQS